MFADLTETGIASGTRHSMLAHDTLNSQHSPGPDNEGYVSPARGLQSVAHSFSRQPTCGSPTHHTAASLYHSSSSSPQSEAALAGQPPPASLQRGTGGLHQSSSGIESTIGTAGYLGVKATHPLLQLDPPRARPSSGPAGMKHSPQEQHPLLAFDPLAGISPFLEDPVLPDACLESSQLRLQSIAPSDFASELEHHGSPLASR